MSSYNTLVSVILLVIAIHTVNVGSQEAQPDEVNPQVTDVVKTEPAAPTANVNGTAPESAAPPANTIGTEPEPAAPPANTIGTEPEPAAPLANASGTEPEPAANAVEKSKPPPRKNGGKRRPKKRRRPRKRRPRPQKTVNIDNNANAETQTNPDTKPNAEAFVKGEPQTVKGKPDLGNDKKPNRMNSGFAQDPFFDMFTETTTTEPDVNAPPPDFAVDGPPKKKVMPTLGPYKDAYDGTPCNETYKPHENISTKYMRKYAEGVWKALDCAPNRGKGLVWRQDLCACDEELIPQDPDDWCGSMGYKPMPTNRNRYTRRIHGIAVPMDCPGNLIWSQKKCQCIFDPAMRERAIENKVQATCKTILQMEFEGDLKNTAVGYQVNTVDLRRRGKLPRIRFGKIPGSTNRTAMIVSQPLKFLAFRGNDFQKHVTYALSFKVSPRHESRTNFMTLITDECIDNPGRQNKGRKPSIGLSFMPQSRTFRLQFRTTTTEIDTLIKNAQPDSYGWYKCVVYFEDSTVNLECGGKKLFTQTDVQGKVPQNKCPLYIAGRGRGFDRSMDFYGYLDSVYLIKDCNFHEANIKFL
ncbi:hypothetical protein ACF0H5_014042 [Mactra antiquata]